MERKKIEQEEEEEEEEEVEEKKRVHGAIRNVTFILIVSSHSARVSTLPDSTPVIG